MTNDHNLRWHKLKTAYGTAEHVPDLIDSLIDATKQDMIVSLFELTNQIFHQHTVYPATSVTVSYLLLLLEDTMYKHKCRILELLADIIQHASKVVEQYPVDDPYCVLCQDCIDTILASTEIYQMFLESENPHLRMCAFHLLTWFTTTDVRRSDELLARLHSAMVIESETLVRASMLLSLYCVGFDSNLEYSEQMDVRIRFAIIYLENRKVGHTDQRFLDTLTEILQNFEQFEQQFFTLADHEDCLYHPILSKIYSQCDQQLYSNFPEQGDHGHFPWRSLITRSVILQLLTDMDRLHLERIRPTLLYLVRECTPQNSIKIIPPIFTYLSPDTDISFQLLVTSYPEFAGAIYNNFFLWSDFSVADNLKVFRDYHLPLNRQIWRDALPASYLYASTEENAEYVVTRIVNTKLGRRMLRRLLSDEEYSQIKTLKLQHIADESFIPIIARFTNLYELDLSSSEITGAAIANLPIFNNLRAFHLASLELSEETAQYLSRLISLERLTLGNSTFPREWLHYLRSLKNLKLLLIKNTGLQPTDLDELKFPLPDLRVFI